MLTLCHRQPRFDGYRRRDRHGSYNGYRRAHLTNRSGTEAPASRASGGQKVRTQATASTARVNVTDLTCPDADSKLPRAPAAMNRASPPSGVLLDFDNDMEFVQLPPNMVANTKTAQTADVISKGKQQLSKPSAVVGSEELASGVSVRVEGDDKSLHQTNATAAHAASAGLDTAVGGYYPPPVVEEGVVPVPPQPQLPDLLTSGSFESASPHTLQTTDNQKGNSMNCEEVPMSAVTRDGGMLIDLDDDLAVILPVRTNADTGSASHSGENDVLASGLDSGVKQNSQPEDLEEDQIVFQGNAAKEI